MVFGSGFQPSVAVLPRLPGPRPGSGRTYPRSMFKSRLRTIHRLLSANSIVRRAVFLARPRLLIHFQSWLKLG